MNELKQQFLDFVSSKFGDGKNAPLWDHVITHNEVSPESAWDDCVEDIVKQAARKGAIEVLENVLSMTFSTCGACQEISKYCDEKISHFKNHD